MRLEFTCCCAVDWASDVPWTTRPYLVTDHEGQTVICEYCDDCAELAAVDWNGETAAIVPSFGASAAEYRECSEAADLRSRDEIAYAYRDIAKVAYHIASDGGQREGNDKWASDGCAAMLLALHVERTGRVLPFGDARIALMGVAEFACAS